MPEIAWVLSLIFGYWVITHAINVYENVQLAKYSCVCDPQEEGEEENATTSTSESVNDNSNN
jgi:hypothetical protein